MNKVFFDAFPHDGDQYTCNKCGATKPASELRVLIVDAINEEDVKLGPLCDKCIEERGPSMFGPDLEEMLLAKSFESQTSHFS